MKTIDRIAGVDRERYVHADDPAGFQADPKERLLVGSVPCEGVGLGMEALDAERLQDRIVEVLDCSRSLTPMVT